MGVDLEQDGAVHQVGHDVAALHAVLAGGDAILQVKAHIGGLFCGRQLTQQRLGVGQRQFGIDRVVVAGRIHGAQADAAVVRQEDQLVGVQFAGNLGGHVFHREVEGFAGGREAEGRQQHHGAAIQHGLDGRGIDLAHQAGVLVVDAIDNADRAGREEVAGDDAHRGAGHGGVGQALAEGSLDLVAQLAGGFERAIQRDAIGDAGALVEMGFVALGAQLLVDLGAEAMHQHDLHAHALDQCQVLRDVAEFAGSNGFTGHANHDRLAPVHVNVWRY